MTNTQGKQAIQTCFQTMDNHCEIRCSNRLKTMKCILAKLKGIIGSKPKQSNRNEGDGGSEPYALIRFAPCYSLELRRYAFHCFQSIWAPNFAMIVHCLETSLYRLFAPRVGLVGMSCILHSIWISGQSMHLASILLASWFPLLLMFSQSMLLVIHHGIVISFIS